MANDFFRGYLKIAPFVLALWRGMEAEAISLGFQRVNNKILKQKKQKFDSFPRPILDVGCGFGEFAGVFFESQVEVGIDINNKDLTLAARGKKYKKLRCEDARKMTFADNSFGSVISMSVLEHIPNTELAIKEIHRVLKPGGIFIFTVPTKVINNQLFFPSLLKKIYLKDMADWYVKKFHQVFKHESLYSAKKWKGILKKSDFKLLHEQGTISNFQIKAFDILLFTAFPSQVARAIFGRRFVIGGSFKQYLLEPIYNRVRKIGQPGDANILFIAQKIS